MTVKVSTGAKNQVLDTGSFKQIFANGRMEIRQGNQPASPDNPPSGALLGVVTLDAGAFTPGSPINGLNFGTSTDGKIPKDPGENWKFNGVADGTSGYYRLKGNGVDDDSQSSTLPRVDGAIATAGADLNMSNTAVVTGAPNTIDSFSYEWDPAN